MDASKRSDWIDLVSEHVLMAVAGYPLLRDSLIFKGARILNLHLGQERRSFDIDSNVVPEFSCAHSDLDGQMAWFEEHLSKALDLYFESQEPVRFTLEKVTVTKYPQRPHPHDWNALQVRIRILDQLNRNVRSLPAIEIDISAPELLGPDAMVSMQLDGHSLQAYSLFRIAGEKMRAYLTSLPAYRMKMSSNVRDHRVKDLHDLARILERHCIEDVAFWKSAAREFQLACKSRYVDCGGLDSFREDWAITKNAYEGDAKLRAIPFAQVEEALACVVAAFEAMKVFPIVHPLPSDG